VVPGASILAPPEPPYFAEEAPGARLGPPHLCQAGRGGVAPCPPGAGGVEVTVSSGLVDKLRELLELLKNVQNQNNLKSISHLRVRTRDPGPGPLNPFNLDRPEAGDGDQLQLLVQGVWQLRQGGGHPAAQLALRHHFL
jgi:hypothetical protein